MTRIAASILAADLLNLEQEVAAVLQAGADWVHIDVMDHHYVPNLTFGPWVCEAIRAKQNSAFLDVHLMATPVDELIPKFAKAGANLITFHPEASFHIDRSLQLIRDQGCLAGLAFNPATPLDCLPYVLEKVDCILLMSVNPGFGGQQFLPSVLPKINSARLLIEKASHPIWLAVDGGLNTQTVPQVAQAGADTFIVGNALFKTKNYPNTIKELRHGGTFRQG